jgi:hypothetical protein
LNSEIKLKLWLLENHYWFDIAMISIGADAYSARGMMFALGCIKRCNAIVANVL